MIALTVEDRTDLLRWLVSGAIILCAYGAIAASVLLGAPPPDEISQGAAIVIELAEMPVAAERRNADCARDAEGAAGRKARGED